MKSTALLAAVLADLATFATSTKGVANAKPALARDPFHTMHLLSAAPESLVIILQDDGDEPLPGTQTVDALLAQNFSVFVGIPVSKLAANPAADLLEERGDRPSLTELCDLVRERVASRGQTVSNAGDVSYPDYLGRVAVIYDGVPMAAYQLRFRMEYAGDALTLRPPA